MYLLYLGRVISIPSYHNRRPRTQLVFANVITARIPYPLDSYRLCSVTPEISGGVHAPQSERLAYAYVLGWNKALVQIKRNATQFGQRYFRMCIRLNSSQPHCSKTL